MAEAEVRIRIIGNGYEMTIARGERETRIYPGTRHASPRAARKAAADMLRRLVASDEVPYGDCPHFEQVGNRCLSSALCAWQGAGVAYNSRACATCGHRAIVEWGYGGDR